MVYIITPVFNSSKFIAKTVQSVQKQTLSEWHLVLINDCSTDNSLEVINELADGDKRISILSTGKNSGPAHARNIGVEYAISQGAEYISFIDSDDLYEPNFLQVMLSKAKDKEADIVWGNYYEETYNKSQEGQTRKHGFCEGQDLGLQESLACFYNETTGIGCIWNKLYRTSFIEQTGIRLNEDRVRGEDWEFNLNLFKQLPSVCIVEAQLYHYVHQERASVMATFRREDYQNYWRSHYMLEDTIKSHNLKIDLKEFQSKFVYHLISHTQLMVLRTQGKDREVFDEIYNDNRLLELLNDRTNYRYLTAKQKVLALLVKFRQRKLITSCGLF